MYKHVLKRLIDFILAVVAITIASPIFIVITALLAIANSGKPFFVQPRPGKKGVIFKVIKFKTMNDARGADGELLPDADRLTLIGRIVRKTSLDEIPQLINVIKGDMSLIGPRPLLVEYLPLYNDFQARRHDVRPGITGWAQINGRNAISWERKFELDVFYVDHLSAWFDIKIIFLTVWKVIKSEGVSAENHVTTENFKGNG